jgi:4-hydroxy-4-methyl-2-oxoglutarate aldolase
MTSAQATASLTGFDWSTPFIVDACVALGLPVRTGAPGLVPLTSGTRAAGRACPARHAGSVDVFLEAIHEADRGDVLVIDNVGRRDEGCIGDLVAGEALMAGLAGILVYGTHRDTTAIRALGIPVWSLGSCPVGPQELRARSLHAREAASIGAHTTVTREDIVFLDEDGVIVVDASEAGRVIASARDIAAREIAQATRLLKGERLWDQLGLDEYLAGRRENPELTFREHLKSRGGAIEI